MRAIILILALLLTASTAWAGPEMLLAVGRGGLPADETFTASTSIDSWTNPGGWGWEPSSYSGPGLYVSFGGASPATRGISKTFTATRAGTATIYSKVYTGSATSCTLCNGAYCTNLDADTWTKSGTVPINIGNNTLTLSVTGITVGVEVDSLEFR